LKKETALQNVSRTFVTAENTLKKRITTDDEDGNVKTNNMQKDDTD
jgi:hypothetical protein